MKTQIAAVALAVLATAVPAHADETSGLSLGLRAGYSLPFGEAGDGASLRSLTTGAIPVQLEAGWRFDDRWLAGAFVSVGPTFAGGGARNALRAQGAGHVHGLDTQRLGVQGIYTILPEARLAPWVGLAFGYEWTRYAGAKLADGRQVELGMGGYEAALQVGGDYRLTPKLSAGPFAAVSVGQYRCTTTCLSGSDSSNSVSDRSFHGWFTVGVKGTINL